MAKIDRIDPTPYVEPIGGLSAAPQAVSHDPARSTLKPALDSPMSRVIGNVLRLEKTAEMFSILRENDINELFKEIEKLQLEQSRKYEETIAAQQDVSFWGIMDDLVGVLTGSISAVFGLVAIQNGAAYTGGVLIATGITNVSNIAFKYAGAWDLLAETIADENTEMREAIRTYIPAAIGVTAAVVSAYCSYQLWNLPQMTSQKQGMAILEGVASVVSGLTAMGNGVASARFTKAGAALSFLQTKTSLSKLDLDRAAGELSSFHRQQFEVGKHVAELIEAANQSIQMIQQPV